MSYQQEKFKEIADAIREKTGDAEPIKPSDFAEKQTEVFDAGKKAEHDSFWDGFQQAGERRGYVYGFSGKHWTDAVYSPIYPITTSSYAYMYYNSAITDTLVPITFIKGNTANVFNGASSLKTIRSITVDENQTFSNWFEGCTALVNITFTDCVIGNSIDFGACPLSKESVESIVAALSDTASGQTVTFNSARMEIIDGGSTWWGDLKASKPDWTFALSD